MISTDANYVAAVKQQIIYTSRCAFVSKMGYKILLQDEDGTGQLETTFHNGLEGLYYKQITIKFYGDIKFFGCTPSEENDIKTMIVTLS